MNFVSRSSILCLVAKCLHQIDVMDHEKITIEVHIKIWTAGRRARLLVLLVLLDILSYFLKTRLLHRFNNNAINLILHHIYLVKVITNVDMGLDLHVFYFPPPHSWFGSLNGNILLKLIFCVLFCLIPYCNYILPNMAEYRR